MKVAIVGAGAAGCFCAVELRRLMPNLDIYIYDRAQKPLQKVAITGGGRCNLTNSFVEVTNLQQVYPRGYNLMKRVLRAFDHRQTMQWWEQQGVRLVTQDDQCVFPRSQDAMEIVNTLLRGMRGVHWRLGHKVDDVTQLLAQYDVVLVASGGSPKAEGLEFVRKAGLEIVPPVPSLFTFNLDSSITSLMGVVTPYVVTGLAGTKYRAEGPLLITHWGVSGPAVLKLSSHAARWLAEQHYHATLMINWLGGANETVVQDRLRQLLKEHPAKQISSIHTYLSTPVVSDSRAVLPGSRSASFGSLNARLWSHLLESACIDPQRRCSELGQKQLSRLVAALTNSTYSIVGRCTHKEEFVTCGGVALSEINPQTMECRKCERLFIVGEALDVDAVTGGFNLQAAWSMAYVAARGICAKMV